MNFRTAPILLRFFAFTLCISLFLVGGNLSVMAQDQITLRVMIGANELSEDEIAAFEAANPDIIIERSEWDEIAFNATLAAGTPPDVFRTNASALRTQVARGIVLDLTDYFAASELLQPENLAPAVSYYIIDGRNYGVPKDWSPDFSLYISNNAFEAAGVEIPSLTEPLTYADIAALAEQLTVREGDRTLQFGFAFEPGFLEPYVQVALAEQGGALYSEDFSEIHLQDNPAAVATLRYFYDLSERNLIANPLNPASSWPGQVFVDGQVAMLSYGYWFSGMINGLPADSPLLDNVTMLPSPTWTEGGTRLNPTVGPTGDVISATTAYPDQAFRFLEWYAAGTPAEARAASGWGVPALVSLYELMPNENVFQQQVQTQLQSEIGFANFVIPINPYYDRALFSTSWNDNLEAALLGEITFDELVANIEYDVQTAIDDGKLAQGL
jgi:multiple sugar transport system substrate-binding protein